MDKLNWNFVYFLFQNVQYSFFHYLSLTSLLKESSRDSRYPGLTDSRPVGRGNWLCITYIHFWPDKDMESLPGWGISSMPGPPPRQHEHEKTRHTIFAAIHANKANMKGWLWWPNDIRGLCGLKLPDTNLTPLNLLQKRNIKICLHKPIDYPTDQLFKEFKVFNISQIYLNVLLKFMHKNLNSFKQYSHNYSTKGLDTFRLFEPKCI